MDITSFRCSHRHSAITHPQCYLEYLKRGTNKQERPANIVLLDIETLPGEYYAFDPKVEYLSPDKQIKDWSISCWSAKRLFDSEIMGEVVTYKEAFNREDASILPGIWKLMDDADVVIYHNGRKFDKKKLYSKFVEHRMPPPSKFLDVDTYRVAKDVFGWSYNRLDELGKKFGIGSKIKMHFDDWKQCLTNNKSAGEYLENMLTYCKNDIAPLLEDVYLTMLPYIPNHPNMNIYSDTDQDLCKHCGSTQLNWGGKSYPTPSGLWESWRCNSCGSTGRGSGKMHKIKSTSVS